MQDEITLIRTFVIAFGKVQLIIAGVDICFYRQICLIRVSIFGDLRAKHKLWSISAPIVACLDVFRSIIYDDSVHLLPHQLNFLSSLRVHFFECSWLRFHFLGDVSSWLDIHGAN